jgi:beta-lactamase class A
LTGSRSDYTLSDQSLASSSSIDLPQQKMKELRAQEAYQLEQSLAKTIQKKIQNAAYQKEKTYSTLVSDIEKSMSFLDSVDKNILLMEETKRNKTRRQFEDWNTQIHGNIQVSLFLFYYLPS